MRWPTITIAIFTGLLWACIPTRDAVRSRAAQDFGCTFAGVEVKDLPAGGWRASGCGQFATYVCSKGTCVMNGPNGTNDESATPPAKDNEAPPKEAGNIAHDGVAFDLPTGFWHDEHAKGEIYRDPKNHHAARLTIEKSDSSAAEWIASHQPEAKTWTAKVGDRELTFATKVGEKLRVTVAVIADKGKVYELACSSDDTTATKTDAVCSKILGSFRLNEPEGGLPGE